MSDEKRREQYPSAPPVEKGREGDGPSKEALERRAWMNRRNQALQRLGAKPKDGINFGKGDRKGK